MAHKFSRTYRGEEVPYFTTFYHLSTTFLYFDYLALTKYPVLITTKKVSFLRYSEITACLSSPESLEEHLVFGGTTHYLNISVREPSYRGNRVNVLAVLGGRQLDGGLDERAGIIVEL